MFFLGFLALFSALLVASDLNPIHRIAFLISVFVCGSFLIILLDFFFLGLTYIIVYVGAIMILFLFVIMMVQIHFMSDVPSSSHRSFLFSFFFLFSLISFFRFSYLNSDLLVNFFFPAWSLDFHTLTDLDSLGLLLYVGYPTALLLVSIALWVVMIGIIKVTMSEKA